jgi:hypothetical protein
VCPPSPPKSAGRAWFAVFECPQERLCVIRFPDHGTNKRRSN